MLQFKNNEEKERYLNLRKEAIRVKGELQKMSTDSTQEEIEAKTSELAELNTKIDEIEKSASFRAFESARKILDFTNRLKCPNDDMVAFDREAKELIETINKHNEQFVADIRERLKEIDEIKKTPAWKLHKILFLSIKKELENLLEKRLSEIKENQEFLESL